MKDSKTFFKPKGVGAKQDIEQRSSHPFRVGEAYANRRGNYEVIKIDPPKITVRYENGDLMVADIEILARIWANLQLPPELPEPKPRPRAASRPAAEPRVPRQPRSSGG